jgi:hypothetical protein
MLTVHLVLLWKFLAEKLFSAGINPHWSARKVRRQGVTNPVSDEQHHANPEIGKARCARALEAFSTTRLLRMMSESVLPVLACSSYQGN